MANLNDFQEQLDILSATKTSIKEAIIGKGQEVSSEDSFSSYADKIDDIVTLEEGTADADATAQDIAYNKTAYVNGTKVTGSIETIGPNEEISGMLMDATTVQKTTIYDEHDNPYPGIQYTFLASGNTLTRDGADVSTNAKYSDIVSALSGTADGISADKILSGKTILGVSGTATSDATATADNIVADKTAYVNGNKVVGNMHYAGGTVSGQTYHSFRGTSFDLNLSGFPKSLIFNTNALTLNGYIPAGRYVQVWADIDALNSYIGLTADKLKVGESVLGITGTYTSDADATASDILYSKTAYVNGQKVAGRMMKHVGDSTYANQLSAPDNTDHFNMYYTSANDKIYIGNFKIGSGYWDGTASSNAYIDKNLVYTKLGLTANKLKVGESVLGVQGTFTSDATATNSDIASGKTAYVNGRKVVGVIVDRRNSGASIVGADVTDTNPYRVTITGTGSSTDEIINSSTSVKCEIANNSLASGIGLTADKIKQGVTILGITGTAQVIKEYSTYQEIEQALLDGDIETGDIVLCGGTYTFYLCEMNTETGDSYLEKLVKESETISPSDYTEAEEQIGDLFGEEESE